MGITSAEDRFRERLRRERESHHWSQADLARKLAAVGLSVHPTTIAKIEAGDRAVRIAEAVAIAEIFGFSLDEAFGRTATDDTEFSYRFRTLQEKAVEGLSTLEIFQRRFGNRWHGLLEFEFTDGRVLIEANGGKAIDHIRSALVALMHIAEMDEPTLSAEDKEKHRKHGKRFGGIGALGRGLAALIPTEAQEADNASDS